MVVELNLVIVCGHFCAPFAKQRRAYAIYTPGVVVRVFVWVRVMRLH